MEVLQSCPRSFFARSSSIGINRRHRDRNHTCSIEYVTSLERCVAFGEIDCLWLVAGTVRAGLDGRPKRTFRRVRVASLIFAAL
ncbi:MAG: hypothetical protein DMF84_04660 [Acidobacteria bacterium]|nr:MAG: hypothetical protein DMF84_04660 [Acidobacteriota bacterium]